MTPAATLVGKSITTIEGLSSDVSHPVQRAWLEEDVPQCGYCQSGQILRRSPCWRAPRNRPMPISMKHSTATSAARGTDNQIRAAIHRAANPQRQVTEAPVAYKQRGEIA